MLRIAHRGASGYAPENTLEAFRHARMLGADGAELDVHRCKSGELVVIHDDTVDRTTNGSGPVAAMTLIDLKALRTHNQETVPTLEEALDALAGLYCFVEVKHEDAAVLAASVMEHYEPVSNLPKKLWLISFHHGALQAAHARYPSLPIGASFEFLTPGAIDTAHAQGARAIIPHHQSFNERDITQAHALGLGVICWTVNDPADITRLQAMGVDGIMSDYPDRLMPRGDSA